jgi:hypothetical protein
MSIAEPKAVGQMPIQMYYFNGTNSNPVTIVLQPTLLNMGMTIYNGTLGQNLYQWAYLLKRRPEPVMRCMLELGSPSPRFAGQSLVLNTTTAPSGGCPSTSALTTHTLTSFQPAVVWLKYNGSRSYQSVQSLSRTEEPSSG